MTWPASGRPAATDPGATGRVKSGTGFFVSRDGFLVTSAHVVSGCPHLSVWAADGTERPSYVIASDRRLDLALVWADGRGGAHSAAITGGAPYAGEEVYTLGFGVLPKEPLRPVLVEGSLMGNSMARPGNRILTFRAKLHAGNSGGALLAGDGSLLGMIIGRDEERPDLGVAIPREDIEAMLSAYGIKLARQASVPDARRFLGAISVLIQCSSPGIGSAEHEPAPRTDALIRAPSASTLAGTEAATPNARALDRQSELRLHRDDGPDRTGARNGLEAHVRPSAVARYSATSLSRMQRRVRSGSPPRLVRDGRRVRLVAGTRKRPQARHVRPPICR